LPPRIIRVGEHLPIKDFSPTVNAALELIQVLWDLNKQTKGGFVVGWQRAMCTPPARVQGRALLNNLVAELQHPGQVVQRMLAIIKDDRQPCSNSTVTVGN
jgi:hypothetical protein